MSESGSKPKKTTDDIVDVSFDLSGFQAEFASDFGRMSEKGRVHVTPEGKVAVSGSNEKQATDEKGEIMSDTQPVSKDDKDKLAAMIMKESGNSWFEAIRPDDDEKALILVNEIIKAGWVPVTSEKDK